MRATRSIDQFKAFTFTVRFAALAMFGLFLLLPMQGELFADSCIDCHSDEGLRITNKNLYRYYQDWLQSPHRQEGVTCSDCHNGNPKAKAKKAAHKGSTKQGDKQSALNFKNIPKTCSGCHPDIYEGYIQSRHFQQLTPKKGEAQGPNCVTCHGSMNIAALNVTTVKNVCSICHNPKTKNHPRIPETAEYLLNKFLSIHRFYRFISLKDKSEDAKEFLKIIDEDHRKLSIHWHTFNLWTIEEKTLELLDRVQKRRKLVGGTKN